ncbi:MAG: hypothetical protein ABEJ61_04430 [Haloferacaceae archaeon]
MVLTERFAALAAANWELVVLYPVATVFLLGLYRYSGPRRKPTAKAVG